MPAGGVVVTLTAAHVPHRLVLQPATRPSHYPLARTWASRSFASAPPSLTWSGMAWHGCPLPAVACFGRQTLLLLLLAC